MLSGITMGQYIPGNSLLHRLDPRTKMFGVLAAAACILTASNWQGFALAALLTITALMLSELPFRILLGSLKSLWILLAFTFLIQVFFTPGTVLAGLGPLKLTQEGIAAGSDIFLRLAMLILTAFLPTLTTPPIKLTAGLESMISPFKRLGVPAHELALMMTLALRFIPTLMQEAGVVVNAQRSRGAGFASGSPTKWARSLLPLFVPLFAGALRRADDMAVAMEARCYRGGANRTRMRELKFNRADFLVLVVTLVVLGAAVALKNI